MLYYNVFFNSFFKYLHFLYIDVYINYLRGMFFIHFFVDESLAKDKQQYIKYGSVCSSLRLYYFKLKFFECAFRYIWCCDIVLMENINREVFNAI